MPLHLFKNDHDLKSTIVIYSQSGVIQIKIFVGFLCFYVFYAHLHSLIASISYNGLFFLLCVIEITAENGRLC